MSESLQLYLNEIERIPLLTPDEEFQLAVRFIEEGDEEAGRKLVTSNLRFVVKIAMEYRNYGVKLADLIQEGNIGLMKAVSKFDPYTGYRLISYAVWWIKACIHNYIQKSWSLVKIGTTQTQRKLFNNLIKGQRHETDNESLSAELGVGERDLEEMMIRMKRDVSLDASLTDDDDDFTTMDLLPSESFNQEVVVEINFTRDRIHETLEKCRSELTEREQFILQHRIMTDEPMTLEEIGDVYQVSRERIRQIEANALRKIKPYFEEAGLRE
jgi:RNA polymerase sigma-32 factor